MKEKIFLLTIVAIVISGCQEYEVPDSLIRKETVGLTTGTELEAVDLGLSVMWANKNLGAKDVYDKGIEVNFGDAKGNGGFYKAEGTFDISGTEYDIAHNMLGGKWRMPTVEEIKELLYKTHSEYDYMYENGHIGTYYYKFTAPSGNSIIVPKENVWSSSYKNGSDGYSYGYYFLDLTYSGKLNYNHSSDPFTKRRIRPVCDYETK